MLKHTKQTLKLVFNNYYLIFGIIIGLFLNVSFIELDCTSRLPSSRPAGESNFNYSSLKAIIRSGSTSARSETNRTAPVRPRYYASELGIREQLFVGVLTSEEKLRTQAAHTNATVAHLVENLKLFMTATPRRKSNAIYSNLIGFVEGRPNHRPFQVIKYIGDNFLHDYDYYYITNDFNYLNARRLKSILDGISVSRDIYAGSVVNDAMYCNLDAGILFSNSVMKAIHEHIQWCVINAVTSDNSENIGRCVYYAAKLECQQNLMAYKLHSFDLSKEFKSLTSESGFREAVTVYPILKKEDFYLLHYYYTNLQLKALNAKIVETSSNLGGNEWPPGEYAGTMPFSRFDVPRQMYFNRTHVFSPDDFTTVRRHKRAEALDIEHVLKIVTNQLNANAANKYELIEIVNGYRTFDMARGLDYVFDLKFKDNQQKNHVKRFEVCKPFGMAEFIPAPYVTENTKVTILLPVEEKDVRVATTFIQRFAANVMDKKEKVLLMLVLLYQNSTPSKGDGEPFASLKDLARRHSARYASEDTKIAWVSIRLPPHAVFLSRHDHDVLNIAIVDLALRKIGVEAILLVADVHCFMLPDFLNRVRINTIREFQVFAPIPFRFYDPVLAEYDQIQISKSTGHFDTEFYGTVAFYGRDYVAARKRSQHRVPLTRMDNDIAHLVANADAYRGRGNLVKMFVEFGTNELHCLRAPDMSLTMLYHLDMDSQRRNWFLATKTQLAKVILARGDQISSEVPV